jgi:hypothetical protein
MTDSFALPALTDQLVDADALDRWMTRAQRGDVLPLAVGRVRPVAAPVWMAAKLAERAGCVRIIAAAGDGGLTRWSVEWLAASDGVAGGGARAVLRAAGDRRVVAERTTGDGEPVTDAMLRRIRRACNLGEGPPSLNALATAAELPRPQDAKHYLDKLISANAVRVDQRDERGAVQRRFAVRGDDGKFRMTTAWADLTGPARKG